MGLGKILGLAALGVGAVAAAPFTGGGSVLGAATLAGSLAGAGAAAAGAGAVGAAAGAALSSNEDEEYNFEPEETNPESIPFLVATLYTLANIDGIVDENEEAFIDVQINKLINDINDTSVREDIKSIIDKIKDQRHTIKLSDAIYYIPRDNPYSVRKDLQKYIELADKIVTIADGKCDRAEEELIRRLKLVLDKGRSAKEELEKLEEEDLLPNYFFSSTGENKKLSPSTVVITKKNSEFKNIAHLQYDSYYVTHPMNPNYLFDLQELDKIDELQMAELQNLARKLGATRFSCKVTNKNSITSNNNSKGNLEANIPNAGKFTASTQISTSSSKEDYEQKYTQYKWKANGHKSNDTIDTLIDSLLWLKNDPQAKDLIEGRVPNDNIQTYKYTILSNKFKKSTSNFNLSAHLSLLGKINSDLKVEAESNLQKFSQYDIEVDITFN